MTDALSQLIEHCDIADRSLSPKVRIERLWAFAKEARDLGAPDVVIQEFTELAHTRGLVADLGRCGAEEVAQVLSWAVRGFNPFAKGPLQ